MINLDDIKAIQDLQGEAVPTSVAALPEQLEQAFKEASALSIPEKYRSAKSIVICGMGGSRFPALITRELYKQKLRLPIEINDDYNIPGHIGPDTVVILSSYSGSTEEVIACAKKAVEKNAMILGICAGGELADFLNSQNAPCYVFDPKFNPSLQPRIGFGYGVGGQLGLLVNLKAFELSDFEVQSAIAELKELLSPFGIESNVDQNQAKQMAQKLYNRYPYYIVAEFLTGVGNAVQNQTNETAKAISSYRVIPELNHHMMEGLKFPTDHASLATFVFFTSDLYSEKIQKRFDITKDVVEQNKVATLGYKLRGTTELVQVFELMGFGSYLSMYLSVLYGQDPAAIPFVDYFKQELKK